MMKRIAVPPDNERRRYHMHESQLQKALRMAVRLKLTGIKLGFLLNFGEAFMKHGITRIVNGLEESK